MVRSAITKDPLDFQTLYKISLSGTEEMLLGKAAVRMATERLADAIFQHQAEMIADIVSDDEFRNQLAIVIGQEVVARLFPVRKNEERPPA